MAYSNFTLETVREEFQLETIESANIFANIEPVPPSEELVAELAKKVQLAVAIRTEKARSELIVTNVLVELREQFNRNISLFSGIDFSVDAEKGLTGICDFLISLSPEQFYLEAPVIVLVEAKNADPTLGIGQCVAEMLAAQCFNQQKDNNISCVYGATTTGTEWLSSNWKDRNFTLTWHSTRLNGATKSSVSFRAWLTKRHEGFRQV